MVTTWTLFGKTSASSSGSKSDWSTTSHDNKNSAGARKKDDWQVINLQKAQPKKHTSFGGLSDTSSSNGGWGTGPCNRSNFPQAVKVPTNNAYFSQHQKLLKSENQAKKQGMFSSTEDNYTKRRDERSLMCTPSKNNIKSGQSSSPSGHVVHDWVNSMDK